MPSRRYRTFALHADLVAWIDRFLADDDLGYRSRAEVIAAAVREFIERRRGNVFRKGSSGPGSQAAGRGGGRTKAPRTP